MDIKTWDELRAPDDRTLHFTPWGLGKMQPEDAAKYQQEVVGGLELDLAVAEGTRRSFDRLRTVFGYGVLCYDLFTLVHDHALLVVEQALRDRFIDYHQGTVTFVDGQGVAHRVPVTRYEDVLEAIKRHRRWKLQIATGPETIPFNGMLQGLYEWARAAKLLRGWRSQGTHTMLADLRNAVAHPTSYHLLGPVDAARTLSDLHEIINQLWGVSTPGGHLYPAPVKRSVVAMAWRKDGTAIYVSTADALRDETEGDDELEFAVVRAVWEPGSRLSDPEISSFDSRYETTRYPAEHLWGPGTRDEGIVWLDANDPQPDVCDYLDRTFIIRNHDGKLFLPMRPDVAAALPTSEQTGQWYAVRADFPNDAFAHVRNHAVSGLNCDGTGSGRQCSAETLAEGSWTRVIEACGLSGSPLPLPPDMRSPFVFSRCVTL